MKRTLSCRPYRLPGRRVLATLLTSWLLTLVAGRTATAEPISFLKLDFTPLTYFQGTAHIDFLGDPPHVHDFTAGCVPLCFLATGGPAPCGVWETPFTIGETVPRSVSLSGTSEHIIAPHVGEPACGPAFTYSASVSVPFGGIIRDVRFTDSQAHGGHTDTHVVALAAFSFVRPGGIEKRGYVHSSMGTHRSVAGQPGAAILNGPEEVPPDTSGAFGAMVLVADPSTNTISLFATVDEIPPSKILLSHIHVGPPGVSGGVVFNIGAGSLWQAFGSGSAIALVDKPFPAANMPMLLSGGCYINVHTPAFPNGEIRGQILQPGVLDVPPPTDELSPHGQLFNAPNPFAKSTVIHFALAAPARVDVRVYDTAGRLMRTLVRGTTLGAGEQQVEWDGLGDDGRPASNGIYYYRLQMGARAETRRMVLMR